MKNKYLVFCGTDRTTGWDAFRGAFENMEKAIEFLQQNPKYTWAEVVDIDQMKVVWSEFGRD
jgi:hypothetical protein